MNAPLPDGISRTGRISNQQKRGIIPRGSVEIRVPDPREPERLILVGAHDARNVYFWRDKDRRHYPVRKTDLLGTDLSEAMTALEDEARRTKKLINDVARDVIAGVHGGYEHREAQRVLGLVRAEAQESEPADWLQLAAEGLRIFRRIERLAEVRGLRTVDLLEELERMVPAA